MGTGMVIGGFWIQQNKWRSVKRVEIYNIFLSLKTMKGWKLMWITDGSLYWTEPRLNYLDKGLSLFRIIIIGDLWPFQSKSLLHYLRFVLNQIQPTLDTLLMGNSTELYSRSSIALQAKSNTYWLQPITHNSMSLECPKSFKFDFILSHHIQLNKNLLQTTIPNDTNHDNEMHPAWIRYLFFNQTILPTTGTIKFLSSFPMKVQFTNQPFSVKCSREP